MQSASSSSPSASACVPSRTHLALPRDLTIAGVAALKTSLVAALEAGRPVDLCGSGVEQVDTVGLQLLLSCRRTAAAAGVEWTLSETSPRLQEHARQAVLAGELGILT